MRIGQESAPRRHFVWPPGGHTAVSGLEAPEQRKVESDTVGKQDRAVGFAEGRRGGSGSVLDIFGAFGACWESLCCEKGAAKA